jgi:type II secretory pathway pseudopilin PulG
MIQFLNDSINRDLMNFHSQRRQRGYILLTLMLFVTLLAIASLAMVEKISFQMKRDREEELIHRGVQYSRAVRRFFKKFGRYPTRIEELENSNNVRFLRKRYKDPVTGKDFKPLHMSDVQVSFNPGAASGMPPGADANISAQEPGAPGALNPGATAPAGFGPSSIPTQNAPAGDQQNPEGTDQQAQGVAPTPSSPQAPGGQDSTQRSGFVTANGANGSPQVFGGGAIIGVASTSKEKTVREFNKKDHYNQWQFIYDPSTDRGGLLMTPNQPPLQGAVPVNSQNGEPGAAGQNPGMGFGQGMNPAPQQPNPQQPNQQ